MMKRPRGAVNLDVTIMEGKTAPPEELELSADFVNLPDKGGASSKRRESSFAAF